MLKKVKAWLRLSECKSLKSDQIIAFVEKYGDPVQFVGQNHPVWNEISSLTPETKNFLSNDLNPYNWDKIQKVLNSSSIDFISFSDDAYPDSLKNIFQPPLFLFTLGDQNLLKYDKNIAIVGTRKPSPYGRIMTGKVSEALVKKNYIIVSGLAAGIDCEAHRAAVENQGKTIAVLAHGLDFIYPPQNKDLAKKILEKGLLISEYPPSIKMEKYYFIQRNRIISGISKGVAVMEGKKPSGAMITAKFALEQNKDIFALPGEINKDFSEGPNSLIHQGAEIITDPYSIVNFYDSENEYMIKDSIPEMNSEEENLWKLIKNNQNPIHSDEIVLFTGLSINQLSGILFMLELKNIIKRIEGNRYVSLF